VPSTTGGVMQALATRLATAPCVAVMNLVRAPVGPTATVAEPPDVQATFTVE
jgi:hypothetical protein